MLARRSSSAGVAAWITIPPSVSIACACSPVLIYGHVSLVSRDHWYASTITTVTRPKKQNDSYI
ncbi:hypothetical protein PRIPAC_81106 [Pristionchus pacificus]|uniref:Uncharacterized protein n=1 Tax=Pristionchus pacificus TaxID=54126 RepID=A0A2A6BYF6_PRIPA|nr:hypothetical protein PRIPAC_81106 [Pristionchus pacificus]|eukprot:PDM70945.1 hypothetical protein PRIPAC_44341 [Pristionchus pacificus]